MCEHHFLFVCLGTNIPSVMRTMSYLNTQSLVSLPSGEASEEGLFGFIETEEGRTWTIGFESNATGTCCSTSRFLATSQQVRWPHNPKVSLKICLFIPLQRTALPDTSRRERI